MDHHAIEQANRDLLRDREALTTRYLRQLAAAGAPPAYQGRVQRILDTSLKRLRTELEISADDLAYIDGRHEARAIVTPATEALRVLRAGEAAGERLATDLTIRVDEYAAEREESRGEPRARHE